MGKTTKVEAIMNALRRVEQKANVAGYVILNKAGEHVGTVRMSYPRDGAGKLVVVAADWAAAMPEGVDFRQWTRWQYGWASGGGYDKRTAAMAGMTFAGVTIADSGWGWDRQLRDAGMAVIQAI